ncbi:hypothetical protein HHK36_014449 [Tetracentron sinense]|uniref:Uncharacterized protein n=1 Tax=Tetracentron sinense TaxID=13715 RepID=A0A834Z838_TETSI|nr:hypothetical protein HHK36_014449 [Tetracentron sinense]
MSSPISLVDIQCDVTINLSVDIQGDVTLPSCWLSFKAMSPSILSVDIEGDVTLPSCWSIFKAMSPSILSVDIQGDVTINPLAMSSPISLVDIQGDVTINLSVDIQGDVIPISLVDIQGDVTLPSCWLSFKAMSPSIISVDIEGDVTLSSCRLTLKAMISPPSLAGELASPSIASRQIGFFIIHYQFRPTVFPGCDSDPSEIFSPDRLLSGEPASSVSIRSIEIRLRPFSPLILPGEVVPSDFWNSPPVIFSGEISPDLAMSSPISLVDIQCDVTINLSVDIQGDVTLPSCWLSFKAMSPSILSVDIEGDVTLPSCWSIFKAMSPSILSVDIQGDVTINPLAMSSPISLVDIQGDVTINLSVDIQGDVIPISLVDIQGDVTLPSCWLSFKAMSPSIISVDIEGDVTLSSCRLTLKAISGSSSSITNSGQQSSPVVTLIPPRFSLPIVFSGEPASPVNIRSLEIRLRPFSPLILPGEVVLSGEFLHLQPPTSCSSKSGL